MASLYQFNEMEMLAFFLVLLRVSGFLVSWPVFGVESVPPQVKILLGLLIAFILFPAVGWQQLQGDLGSQQLFWYAIREVFIGLAIGFLARAFFYVFAVAGQIISVSMGLSSIQLFNPTVGDRSSAFDQLLVGLGSLFFLAINGHHIFLGGLRDSFVLVPLSGDLISTAFFGQMGVIVQEITAIGVKVSAPVLIAILFMNVAMAVIGRAVPQINVLITSLPVNIMVGFLVIFVSLPLIIWQMHDLLDLTAERVFQMMKSF